MSNELRYFNALKRITEYQTVEQLRRNSEKDWGCSFEEALEMAYENLQGEARQAVQGKRKPRTDIPQRRRQADGKESCRSVGGPSEVSGSGLSSGEGAGVTTDSVRPEGEP